MQSHRIFRCPKILRRCKKPYLQVLALYIGWTMCILNTTNYYVGTRRRVLSLLPNVLFDLIWFFLICISLILSFRIVHTLSHNFRSATSVVRASLRLPLKPDDVLLKIIYAGVNASDVRLLLWYINFGSFYIKWN